MFSYLVQSFRPTSSFELYPKFAYASFIKYLLLFDPFHYCILGVVGTGLFLGTAHQAYIGKADGSVNVIKNPNH